MASDPLAQLLDVHAIVTLTEDYCWALDDKDYERLRDVFLPDATADVAESCTGVDAIIERVKRSLDPLDVTQHLVTNHRVVVDGDRATCRCQLQSQHVRRGVEGGRTYLVGGRYHDQLERTPAGWRIRHRELVITWTDGNRAVVGLP
jgi:ketosteroid isomerase-like protein